MNRNSFGNIGANQGAAGSSISLSNQATAQNQHQGSSLIAVQPHHHPHNHHSSSGTYLSGPSENSQQNHLPSKYLSPGMKQMQTNVRYQASAEHQISSGIQFGNDMYQSFDHQHRDNSSRVNSFNNEAVLNSYSNNHHH